MRKRSLTSDFILELRKRRGYSVAYIAHLMNCPIIKYIQFEENSQKTSMKLLKEFFNRIEATEAEKRTFGDIYFYESIDKLYGVQSDDFVKTTDLKIDTNNFPFNVIPLAGRRSVESQKDKEIKNDAD